MGEAEYDTILSKGTKEKLSLEKNNSDLFLGHRDWNDRNTTREEIETNRLSISKAEPELETVYWLSLNLCQVQKISVIINSQIVDPPILYSKQL